MNFKGKHCETLAPDTYDIHERAQAVQNALISATDPDFDYQVYFRGEWAYITLPAVCEERIQSQRSRIIWGFDQTRRFLNSPRLPSSVIKPNTSFFTC